MAQRDRVKDPYPWTWEIPVGVAIAVSMGVLVAIQVGRGLATLVAAGDWTWPSAAATPAASGSPTSGVSSPLGAAFWTSLPGVLSGDANAGLAPPDQFDHPAGPLTVWSSVAAVELVLICVGIWVAIMVSRRWGPSRVRGVATRLETETLLGRARLRKVAPIIRPDLFAQHPRVRTDPTTDPAMGNPGEREGQPLGRGLTNPWLRRRSTGPDVPPEVRPGPGESRGLDLYGFNGVRDVNGAAPETRTGWLRKTTKTTHTTRNTQRR